MKIHEIHMTLPASVGCAKGRGCTVALLSDTHGNFTEELRGALKRSRPDLIAVAGDYGPLHTGISASPESQEFLRFCASSAPTYFALGNHEEAFSGEDALAVTGTGAVLLDDSAVQLGSLSIGGLSSGYVRDRGEGQAGEVPEPNLRWLETFAGIRGYKILICHHPEYYEPYIQRYPINLVLSGHAHGGQIRLFGRGLYAPGQGWLPRYTSGLYDGRLVVSRGLCNTARHVPRLWNPTELVLIRLHG